MKAIFLGLLVLLVGLAVSAQDRVTNSINDGREFISAGAAPFA